MSAADHKDITQLAFTNFHEPDEPIYPVLENYPLPFPVRYTAYDIGAAAFEALMEKEPKLLKRPLQFIVRKKEIENELQEIIPDWEDIYLARSIAALALNNYAGPGRAFCVN